EIFFTFFVAGGVFSFQGERKQGASFEPRRTARRGRVGRYGKRVGGRGLCGDRRVQRDREGVCPSPCGPGRQGVRAGSLQGALGGGCGGDRAGGRLCRGVGCRRGIARR